MESPGNGSLSLGAVVRLGQSLLGWEPVSTEHSSRKGDRRLEVEGPAFRILEPACMFFHAVGEKFVNWEEWSHRSGLN